MKLWLLTQMKNRDYNTYDSVVVSAETKEDARKIHPDGTYIWDDEVSNWYRYNFNREKIYTANPNSWVYPNEVIVVYLGEAVSDMTPNTVICASFIAG